MKVLIPILSLMFVYSCGDSQEVPNGALDDSGNVQGTEADAGFSEPDTGPAGIASLGLGRHDESALTIEVVGDSGDGLNGPRDLAFHPDEKGQLWVVNRADESVVIFGDATGSNADALKSKQVTSSGHHFLAYPASIALGMVGYNNKRNLATIHETDQLTQGAGGTPADFMGPTLFTSDLAIFDGGWGGHLDMLHNSPNGMGIAWEKDNVYWVFDGAHSALTRYDFKSDHGPGGADHSDALMQRFVEGKVKRVEGVPSHMEYDAETNLLYLADTGNNRIAVLDSSTATQAGNVGPNYDGTTQYAMTGATLTTLVDGNSVELQKPSGLALRAGILYVTDNATSTIHAFDLQGTHLDWVKLDRPEGSLMGIAIGPDNAIYVVDHVAHELLRIQPAQ